ncbi:MAG: type II secretion system protein GspG [Planctomycetes bacterium]|nr:type II secretion system protein GspG [Planctomycetota bacterium]
MSPTDTPPLPHDPRPPPAGQWSHAGDTSSGEQPKSKLWLWIVLGVGGCFGSIVVVGLVATLVVPQIVRKLGTTERKQTMFELLRVSELLKKYAAEHGDRYPESLELLLQPGPDGSTYLQELPHDGWGHELSYEPATSANPHPGILSFGRDGVPGGTGADTDLRVDG